MTGAMITSLTPHPPCEIRTANHKKAQKNLYRSKAWVEAKKRFLTLFPTCCYCGAPAVIPHHPTRSDYGSPAYIDEITNCEPVCRGCHLGIETGKHICQKCGKHWTKFEVCTYCFSTRERLNLESKKRSEWHAASLQKEVISLIQDTRNGIYVYIDELIAIAGENPEKYPTLAKYGAIGKHHKIAKIMRQLGAEKTRRNHHCKTWVLRRVNL